MADSKDLQQFLDLLRRLLFPTVFPSADQEPEAPVVTPVEQHQALEPQAQRLGFRIHVGINHVSPSAYGGWDGKLNACVFDAEDMHELTREAGWPTHAVEKLIDGKATKEALSSAIHSAASMARNGDSVLITYSGHGGQQPDKNGDESDGRDETWCLFDGEMLDDAIYAGLCRFERGVKVFILSDSCHSGTVARTTSYGSGKNMPAVVSRNLPGRDARLRRERELCEFRENDLQATVLLLSGCQDNQTSLDGSRNGAFTGALKQVWKRNKSAPVDWTEFHKQVQRELPSSQSPNLFVLGPDDGSVPIRKLPALVF